MLGKGGMGEWANTRQRLQKGVDEATGREIHALNKEMIAAGIGKFACGLGARKVAASAEPTAESRGNSATIPNVLRDSSARREWRRRSIIRARPPNGQSRTEFAFSSQQVRH
jgi:hypothetical protein